MKSNRQSPPKTATPDIGKSPDHKRIKPDTAKISERGLSEEELYSRSQTEMSGLAPADALEPGDRKGLIEYLISQDFTKQVDMRRLAELDFDLTEDEEDAFIQNAKQVHLKLMKVMLFSLGLLEKRVAYKQREHEERVEKIIKEQNEVNKFQITEMRDYQSTASFELVEFKNKMQKLYASAVAA